MELLTGDGAPTRSLVQGGWGEFSRICLEGAYKENGGLGWLGGGWGDKETSYSFPSGQGPGGGVSRPLGKRWRSEPEPLRRRQKGKVEELGPPTAAHSRHGSREQRALQVHGQGISMRQTGGGVKKPRVTSQPHCLLLQASVSPPPPSPNQSYEGSSGYNFRPTDARCLPR